MQEPGKGGITVEPNVRTEEALKREQSVVRQYALRWAVLAAWRDAIGPRARSVPDETDQALRRARIKIASGCFSPCEIGCDLSVVEATLTSIDASSGGDGVDFWLGLLSYSMAETAEAERLLKIPAVSFRFADCRVPGCPCAA
jgi:hypothetical protein